MNPADIIVIALIAAVLVIAFAVQKRRGKKGCGGCDACCGGSCAKDCPGKKTK